MYRAAANGARYFDGADKSALVMRLDRSRAARIEFFELSKKPFGRLLFQLRAEFRIRRHAGEEDLAQERVHVKPRSADYDRQFPTRCHLADFLLGLFYKIIGGELPLGRGDIKQMVGNS